MEKNYLNLDLPEDDYKEIFALFSSCSMTELSWIYDPKQPTYYKNENLDEEYSYYIHKREFAYDSWRAVMYFLYKHGFKLYYEGKEVDLSQSIKFFAPG